MVDLFTRLFIGGMSWTAFYEGMKTLREAALKLSVVVSTWRRVHGQYRDDPTPVTVDLPLPFGSHKKE